MLKFFLCSGYDANLILKALDLLPLQEDFKGRKRRIKLEGLPKNTEKFRFLDQCALNYVCIRDTTRRRKKGRDIRGSFFFEMATILKATKNGRSFSMRRSHCMVL